MAKECRQRPFAAQFNAVCPVDFYAGDSSWLLSSWPWWISIGIISVVFVAQLWLLEWVLVFLLLLLIYRCCGVVKRLIAVPLLVLLGVIWGGLAGTAQLSGGLPGETAGRDCQVTGTVVKLPRQRARAMRMRLRASEILCSEENQVFKGDILLNWYQPYPFIEPGQRWRLTARLKPATGSLNPGAFNYRQWLFAQNIDATGYVRDGEDARLLETLGGHYRLERYRGAVELFIQSLELKNGGLIIALATGVRSGISDDQWRVFRRTGTAHLVAISGLHVGMVATIAYTLAFWLWRYTMLVATQYPAQRFARLISIAGAAFYAGLAGFALPTTRALLMLLVYYLLTSSQRNPGLFFVLGLVLLSVLVFDPLAPLSAGLWLSFGAVMAIAYAIHCRDMPQPGSAQLTETGSLRGMLGQRLWLWMHIQFAVTLGLMPLTLFLFHQVPLVSMPANMLAIPVVALLVVPLILLGVLCLMLKLTVISSGLLSIADVILDALWAVLNGLSGAEFAVVSMPYPHAWELAVAALGFVLLYRASLGVRRWVGLLALVPLLVGNSSCMEEGTFELDLLDVGQGLAVLIRTSQHTLLYDAGVKYRDGFDAGEAIVLPFLRYQGVDRLNVAVASHDNLDHVGGISSLVEQYPGAALYSSAAFYPGSRACEVGQSWQWDGVHFSFLHPRSSNESSSNDGSCVLKIEGQFGSVLLTGDIERAAERHLLETGDAIADVDVLLVPHHGSRSSSTLAFLGRVNPRMALVSAGYLNRFRHPHFEIVERYRERDVPVLNTAQSGWINVRLDRRGVTATPYRSIYRRYWLLPHGERQPELIHLPLQVRSPVSLENQPGITSGAGVASQGQ